MLLTDCFFCGFLHSLGEKKPKICRAKLRLIRFFCGFLHSLRKNQKLVEPIFLSLTVARFNMDSSQHKSTPFNQDCDMNEDKQWKLNCSIALDWIYHTYNCNQAFRQSKEKEINAKINHKAEIYQLQTENKKRKINTEENNKLNQNTK